MYLISKGSLQGFQKYTFHGNLTIPPEITIFFQFWWSKLPISIPDIRNFHVTHQIDVNKPRIIIKMILTENFYSESKYTEK